MWFTDLTGLDEDSPQTVRRSFDLDGDALVSKLDGRRLPFGELETPSLSELRERNRKRITGRRTELVEVIGDAQQLHADPSHAGSVFQVASQFNLLEMISPSVTPEDGVARYSQDRTQGPACAMACGGALLYRNYFVPLDNQIGQSELQQIDCARDLGSAIGNRDERLWRMRNGYLLPTSDGMAEIRRTLDSASTEEINGYRSLLRVGLQRDATVTLNDASHRVHQVFCSAAPIAYSSIPADDWEPLARLILEAAYEATLLAGSWLAEPAGSQPVFLTLLGGGAFGNPLSWIVDAIERATSVVHDHGLDVRVVSFRHSQPALERLLRH